MRKIDIANQLIGQLHQLESACWSDDIDLKTMHRVVECVENLIMSWAAHKKSIALKRMCFKPLEEYQRIKRENYALKEKLNEKNGWHKLNSIDDQPKAAGHEVWLSIKHKGWVTDRTLTIEAFNGYGDYQWHVTNVRSLMEDPEHGHNKLASCWIPLAWKEKDYYEVSE